LSSSSPPPFRALTRAMPLVRIGAIGADNGFHIARLAPDTAKVDDLADLVPAPKVAPQRVRLAKDGNATAESSKKEPGAEAGGDEGSGTAWTGRLTDVKPLLHWVLEKGTDGGYRLRPVRSWYEFTRISAPGGAQALKLDGKKRKLGRTEWSKDDPGARELQRDAELRHSHAERWKGIMQRRQERVGVSVGVGKAMAPEAEQAVPEVMYPDKEFAADDTGLRGRPRSGRSSWRRRHTPSMARKRWMSQIPPTRCTS